MKKQVITLLCLTVTFLSIFGSNYALGQYTGQAPEPPSYSPPPNFSGPNIPGILATIIVVTVLVAVIIYRIRKWKAGSRSQVEK